MKTIVIVGSSRNDGDTSNLTNLLIEKSNWDIIHLNDYNFSYYDYHHENRNDNFYSRLFTAVIIDTDLYMNNEIYMSEWCTCISRCTP